METLPPTQKWAFIWGSVPCWDSHTDVGTAKAALKAQKAALGSNQLSMETLTTLVSDLTFTSPVPCCMFSPQTHLYTVSASDLVLSSRDLFRVSNKHLSSLSCNPSYQPLNQLQVTFTKCMLSSKLKLLWESHGLTESCTATSETVTGLTDCQWTRMVFQINLSPHKKELTFPRLGL